MIWPVSNWAVSLEIAKILYCILQSIVYNILNSRFATQQWAPLLIAIRYRGIPVFPKLSVQVDRYMLQSILESKPGNIKMASLNADILAWLIQCKLILTKQYIENRCMWWPLIQELTKNMVQCLLVCSSCALLKHHLKMKSSFVTKPFHQHNLLLWKQFAIFLMLFTNFTA